MIVVEEEAIRLLCLLWWRDGSKEGSAGLKRYLEGEGFRVDHCEVTTKGSKVEFDVSASLVLSVATCKIMEV